MGTDRRDTPSQSREYRARPTVTPAPSRSFPIPASRTDNPQTSAHGPSATSRDASHAGSHGTAGSTSHSAGRGSRRAASTIHNTGDGAPTGVRYDGSLTARTGSGASPLGSGRVAPRSNVTRRLAQTRYQGDDQARYFGHADSDYPVPGVRRTQRAAADEGSGAGSRDPRPGEHYIPEGQRQARLGEHYTPTDQRGFTGERYTRANQYERHDSAGYPRPGERASRPATPGRRRASTAGSHGRTAPGRTARSAGAYSARSRHSSVSSRSTRGYIDDHHRTPAATPMTRFVRAIQNGGYAVADWGWKTWAASGACVLALIVVISMVVNHSTATSGNASSTAVTADVAAGTETAQASAATTTRAPEVVDERLPDGGPYTESGQGTYRAIGQPGEQVGQGTGGVITYTVEVEDGLNPEDYGGDDAVAAMIDQTLSDPKSWTKDSQFAFRHVGAGEEPRLHIQLSSPQTTHTNCGYSIKIETSCFTSAGNRVILNESRWIRGSSMFDGDITGYRQYMINHEVGHGIGYAAHVPCLEDGALAPIMMQQTLSLANSPMYSLDEESSQVYPDDHKVCRPNPWPYPTET